MTKIIINKKTKKILKKNPLDDTSIADYLLSKKIPAIHRNDLIIVDDKDISKAKLKQDLNLSEEL